MPVDVPVSFANVVAGQVRELPHLVKSLAGAESPEEYVKAQKAILEHPALDPSSIPLSSSWWERQAGEAGLPTTKTTKPTTTAGKMLQRATEEATALAAPGIVGRLPGLAAMGAMAPGSPLVNAAIGAGTGAAGEATAELAGERYRPLAEAVTGAIGSAVPALASTAYAAVPPLTAASREAAAREAAINRFGAAAGDIGSAEANLNTAPQEMIPGSRATAAEMSLDPDLLAAQRVRERESPELGAAMRERRGAANQARFNALEGMSPTAATPADTKSYLNLLLQRSDELTEQDVTGLRNTAAGARAGASPSFPLADQGSAVRDAIDAARSPVGEQLREAHEAASEGVQEAMRAFGGEEATGTAEERAAAPARFGEQMREPVQQAYDNERQRLSALRAAIDPSGTMGMSPAPIKQAAAAIGTNFSPDTFGGMEKNFYNRVEGWAPLIPIEDAFRLRADINSRLRNVADHNPQEQLRLVTLKEGVDQALGEAAATPKPSPPPPPQSLLTPEDRARLAEWYQQYGAGAPVLRPLTPEAQQRFTEWNKQYGEMARAFRGETGGQLHAVGKMLQKGGAYDSYKLRDDEVPWLFVNTPKSAPPQALDRFLAVTPPEAHGALDDAFSFSLRRAAQNPDGTLNLRAYQKWQADHQDALTRRPDLAARFGAAADAQARLNDVSAALAQHTAEYPLKPGLGDSSILRQFWKPGPEGADSMARFAQITGGSPKALAAAADYAAYDFANRPGIIRNGEVVPSAAEAWIKQHDPALSAIPGLKDKFATAADAQRTLETAIEQHQERRDLFTKSVAGSFIQDDPARAIERVFSGKDRAQKANILMQLTASDSAAQQGIQQATIDYMRRLFEGTGLPGSEAGALKVARFGDFVDNNRDVLRMIFPGRSQLFDTIAADAKRGALVQGAKMPGGSDTAELLAHMTGPEQTGVSPIVAGYLGERVAEHAPSVIGMLPFPGAQLLAAIAGYVGAKKLQAGRENLRLSTDRMFDQMLLDPAMAKEALAAYQAASGPKPSQIPDRFLGRLIGQTILNSTANP
jgi:hypothetical protein